MNNTTSQPSSLPNHTERCKPPFKDENPLPLVDLYSIVLKVGLPAYLITILLTFLEVCQHFFIGIYFFSLSLCNLIYLSTLWAIYINSGQRWYWSPLACKVTGCIFFNNMYISISLLCCVSVDHFVAVVYAVESRGLRKIWDIRLCSSCQRARQKRQKRSAVSSRACHLF